MKGTQHPRSGQTGQEAELQHRLDQAADRMLHTRHQLGVVAARYEEGVMIGLAQALNVVTGTPIHEAVRHALDGATVSRHVGLRRGSSLPLSASGRDQVQFRRA